MLALQSKSGCNNALPIDIIRGQLPAFLHHDEPSRDMIYVCGGRSSKVLDSRHYCDSVEMFDIRRNEWIEMPPMTTKRVGAAAVEIKGKLYVLGGYRSQPDNPLASCEVFDPRTGEWSRTAPMGKARFGHAAAAVGDFIYVIGGDCMRALVSEVERYDCNKNVWEVVARLPRPVAGCRVLESNGMLYLVGGDTGSLPLSFSDQISVLNTADNTWSSLDRKLQFGRSACAVAWLDDVKRDTIVIVGGFSTDGDSGVFTELSSTELVPIHNGMPAPRAVPDLPCTRAGCRAVTLGNKVFVIGGGNPERASTPDPQEAASRRGLIDLLRQRIQNLRENNVDVPAHLVALLSAADEASTSDESTSPTVLVFDTASWTWGSESSRMVLPRTAAAVCVASGFPKTFGYDNAAPRWMPEAKRCEKRRSPRQLAHSG